MHDLLHDLALKVASHDCLSFRLSDVGSVEIRPSTRHLSISIEHLGEYNAVSGQKLKRELEKLKTRLKVEHLQTLMLFGRMDEGFAKIFGDFLGETNALRVLHLPHMNYPVESMLHKFSGLVHLRYLCLGTDESQMHLPSSISKFYHLRVLDLELWYGSCDFPEDICNLAKLCHYYTPRDELRFDICNVGNFKLLENLKVFRVNKKSEGFEPKQLEHLSKLWELGIYNLEKIHTEDEAAQAKLIEKKCLRRLALDWDSEQSSVEPCMEGVVLQSLQPHGDLQVLCIRGYGGPSCPTWLHDELDLRELRLKDMARLKEFIIGKSFCMLRKLELIGLISFEKWVYPAELEASLDREQLLTNAHMLPLLQVLVITECPKFLEFPVPNHILYPGWFPKLQELEIQDCPEFLSPLSWTENLCYVWMENVKLLERFKYSRSSDVVKLKIIGEGDLHSLDQVLFFDKETCLEKLTLEKCPPLEMKHLLMLTSLKTLIVKNSVSLVRPLGGQGDVEWQHPVEHIKIWDSNGNTGEELTELLPHLPKLSKLEIRKCKNIKKLVVGVDVQQTAQETTSEITAEASEITAAAEEEDDGVLLFPPHLCESLLELVFYSCPELVLVDPPTLVPGGGGLQALQSLQRLTIMWSPKFLSAFSFSSHIFPSSLQFLELVDVKGMGTLEPLSNLSSLIQLELEDCGEDLKCQGLQSLLTTGGQLRKLQVSGSPRFFSGWDPNPRQALEDVEGGEEQHTQLIPSTLRELYTNDAGGLLSAPICSFLSSSLTNLDLSESWSEGVARIECFSKEQEDALQLLSSLQNLEFSNSRNLQQLPAGLSNLTSLKKLTIKDCPAISSLPKDGLPKSLQELDVHLCKNKELKQQCRGLVGTIPRISINTYGIYGD
ncbi:hypothetical protein ACQJBY_014394 [Aegilops geniculata]